MPRAHQIRAQILTAANQVAQLLLLGRWDPDQPQVAGGEQPREADRIALVGLDPITRPALDVARRADRHLDPLRPRPAHQAIAGRPRLIDRPQWPPQLAQHVEHLQRAADHPARAHLPGNVIEHRERARLRVNIPARPNAYRSAWSAPSMCGRGRGPNPRPVELRAMRGASTISLPQPPD